MKIVAIIQVRMGSARLPGKALTDIAGKPAIEHVYARVMKAKTPHEVWLATTTNPEDDAIFRWANENRILCFRGSAQDVLSRYYETAKQAGADVVIRITGDCPLIDPAIIDKVVTAFKEGNFDYVANTVTPTFPDGLDTEVFSMEALRKACNEAKLPSEREHVTPYIWKQPELFKIGDVRNDIDLSGHRWTLDTKEDLEFIRLVIEEIQKRGVEGDLSDILLIIKDNPDWAKINHQYKRNEGYAKSLKEDTSL